MKYRKKPVVIEATQWFKNGDHPEDHADRNWPGDEREGLVVRKYQYPDAHKQTTCGRCGNKINVHGWIDMNESGYMVCPGDWIITSINGEYYPCRPDVFEQTYEVVE